MSRITRCAHCIGGTVLGGSCIACGRSAEPERVTLRDALSCLAEPDSDPSMYGRRSDRQTVPISVSLERVRLWSRGESAP